MDDDSLKEFELFLDSKKENVLFVKFKYKPNSAELEEFVLIYFTMIENKLIEVIKYDFSQREKLHVHLTDGKTKQFLDEEPNIETLINLKNYLALNWAKFLLKFRER
jgi:hypothetical protein